MNTTFSQHATWAGPGWYAPKLVQGAVGHPDFLCWDLLSESSKDDSSIREQAEYAGRGTPLYFSSPFDMNEHFRQPLLGNFVTATHRMIFTWGAPA